LDCSVQIETGEIMYITPAVTRITLGLIGLTATGAVSLGVPSGARAAEPAPVEVMVVGTYHLSNPGQDLNNVKVEDVRSPAKQAQLEALAERLAAFRPTKIVIEREARSPTFEVAAYGKFTPATLLENRSEDAQIGYRLAAKLGHKAVYGFDEQPGPGEPDYFPFDKVQSYAAANGKGDWLQGLFASAQAYTKRIEAEQSRKPITDILAWVNDAKTVEAMHQSGYYELLKLGDGEAQPGADLNAMWYLRNAKMFGKLTNIAKPGDRVLVVVGSGHAYWLRHFAGNTPGYRAADPVSFLTATREK
jgi:hypothetical protein